MRARWQLCAVLLHLLCRFNRIRRCVVGIEEFHNLLLHLLILNAKLGAVVFDGVEAAFRDLETQCERSLFVMKHLHGLPADVADRLGRDAS